MPYEIDIKYPDGKVVRAKYIWVSNYHFACCIWRQYGRKLFGDKFINEFYEKYHKRPK